MASRRDSGAGEIWSAIVGFARDEEGHWVARLACGHGQHMRHDPPWQERPWVEDAAARRRRLGTRLRCLKCEAGEPVQASDSTLSSKRR